MTSTWPQESFHLTDAAWTRIAQAVRRQRVRQGMPNAATRQFIEAVLWKAVSGAYWSDIPGDSRQAHRIYVRFNRWVADGFWNVVIAALEEWPELASPLQSLVDDTIRASRFRVSRTRA